MPSSSAAWRAAATTGGASCCSDRPPGKLGGEQRVRPCVCTSKRESNQHTRQAPPRGDWSRVRSHAVLLVMHTMTLATHHTSGGISPSAPPRRTNRTLGRPAVDREVAASVTATRRVHGAHQAASGPSVTASLPLFDTLRTVDVAEGHEERGSAHAGVCRELLPGDGAQVVHHAHAVHITQRRRQGGGRGAAAASRGGAHASGTTPHVRHSWRPAAVSGGATSPGACRPGGQRAAHRACKGRSR